MNFWVVQSVIHESVEILHFGAYMLTVNDINLYPANTEND